MVQLAFLLAIIIAGITVITPVVGLTVYFVTRPWLNTYAARQHALDESKLLAERVERAYADRIRSTEYR